MSSAMEYKGYLGSVEFSDVDGIFFGKVMGIRNLLSYEAANAQDLVTTFHGTVDDYLALCAIENKEPERTPETGFSVAYNL